MTIIKVKKKDIQPSPWNPRSKRDPKKLEQLKKSVHTKGCLGPPIVRSHPTQPGTYLITAGRGRLEAYQDDDELEVKLLEEDDLSAQLTSYIENKFREDVSDVDDERFITQIYEAGLKQGRWQSIQEMAALEGLSQEDISKSIIAYKDRTTLGLGDHLNSKLSTTDINESRPLLNHPEARKKLLKLRAKGDIKGSGHIVHDIAKLLACAPDYVIQAFLTNQIDNRNLKYEILNYPTPTPHIAPPITPAIKPKTDPQPSTEPPRQETKLTPSEEPKKTLTDQDKLLIISSLAVYYKEISTKGIDTIKDRAMMKEAIRQLQWVIEKCQCLIDLYYYILYG